MKKIITMELELDMDVEDAYFIRIARYDGFLGKPHTVLVYVKRDREDIHLIKDDFTKDALLDILVTEDIVT